MERWTALDAALLSCEDLSTPGWRQRLADRSASYAVVGGRVVRNDDVRGVLVRRPWIIEQELTHIAACDREYVAAEMNAFLLSWLMSLPCRVLNRPSGTSLCGPNWRPLQWVKAAAGAGMAVEASPWRVPAARKRKARTAPEPPIEVILAGDRCLGAPDDVYAAAVRRLGAMADTGLLAVRFDPGRGPPRFRSATAMPSLRDADVAQAVCDYLLDGPASGGRA